MAAKKKYSFVFEIIRPTSLVLKKLFFCILSLLTRLLRLIRTKTKEYIFWLPFMHSVYYDPKSIDYRPINCSCWRSPKCRSIDSRLTYGPTPWSILDRGIDLYVDGHPLHRTEDPTIVKLRDRRRGFHFRAIFHIANVMHPADRCSISQLAIQFQFALFGCFCDPVKVAPR